MSDPSSVVGGLGALLLAVTGASVAGSLHCVGMCGPFALWATGVGRPGDDSIRRRFGRGVLLLAYHLGRLATYLTAAVAVGIAGAAVTSGGDFVGVQALAARIAGGTMIAMAAWQWIRWARRRRASRDRSYAASESAVTTGNIAASTSPGRVARSLAALRPQINRLPRPVRAFVTGSLTTLLPCGWLYVFLLVASGTGNPISAVAVMFAFWLGTVPALTALVLGSLRVAPSIRGVLPILGSFVLLASGLYTATGRASADMSSLRRAVREVSGSVAGEEVESDTQRRLDRLVEQPLPCCRDVPTP